MAPLFQALLLVTVIGWGAGNWVAIRNGDSKCGDWTSYNDEKCIKVVVDSGVHTRENADVVCKAFANDQMSESSLRILTIKTEEEQKFLEKLLFEDNKDIDNVWLGIRETKDEPEKYEWIDGTRLSYENWAEDTDFDNTHQCVQMTAGRDRDPMGKWLWVSCLKRNNVVCERVVPVTLNTLLSWFTSHKAELERALDASDQKIDELEAKIGEVKTAQAEDSDLLEEIRNNGGGSCKMDVPIGFVYVQLSGMVLPENIWPNTAWDDVSDQYAGLFFRVAEENSTDFDDDVVQEASTVRLAEVQSDGTRPTHADSVTIPEDGSWSRYLTGGFGTGRHSRYCLSTEEIRPRNKPVKLWKRVEGNGDGNGDKDPDQGNEDKDEDKYEGDITD